MLKKSNMSDYGSNKLCWSIFTLNNGGQSREHDETKLLTQLVIKAKEAENQCGGI